MDKLAVEKQVRARYRQIKGSLNERAKRLFAASEVMALGRGGIAVVSRATGIARSTIGQGLKELKAIEVGQEPLELKGRVRRPGGGRKKATEKDIRAGVSAAACGACAASRIDPAGKEIDLHCLRGQRRRRQRRNH